MKEVKAFVTTGGKVLLSETEAKIEQAKEDLLKDLINTCNEKLCLGYNADAEEVANEIYGEVDSFALVLDKYYKVLDNPNSKKVLTVDQKEVAARNLMDIFYEHLDNKTSAIAESELEAMKKSILNLF